MTSKDEMEQHEFGIIRRVVLTVGASDLKTLATCPLRDVHNVMTIGWLLLIVWVWQAVLFTMVGHMMLARSGEWRFEVIAGAVLIATVVLLVDSYVIVRSSWHLQGVAELKRGGLEIPGTVGAKIKNSVFIGVRLLLSTVLAMLTALFLSILLFEKDITANLEQHFQKVNAALLARVTGQVEEPINKLRAEHQDIRSRLALLADEEKVFRGTVIDPTGDNTELKAVLDRLAELNGAKTEALKELTAAQNFAADELGGKKGGGNTGVAGYGPMRRAADEKVAAARRKIQEIGKDIEAAEKQIEVLRETLKGATGSKRSVAEAKLVEIAAQRKEQEDRLGVVESELFKREQSREQVIRTAFESDPSYQRKEEGFLARLEGLERISAQFHVKFVVIIFHIGLFGIELAAVLAKIATFIPSSYATILAYHDYVEIVRKAMDLSIAIRKIHGDGGGDPPEGAPAAKSPRPKPRPPSSVEREVPEGAKDITEALMEVFPQAKSTDDKPPLNDTASRRRKGRPVGPSWRPWLKKKDSDQPEDGLAPLA